MANRIIIKDADGNLIDPGSMRPSSHSAALDGAVRRMLDSRNNYRAAVEREEARLHFTPDGRTDMRRGHAAKAFAELSSAFKQARSQAISERRDAEQRRDAALAKRLSLDPVTVAIRIEQGRILRADPRLRGTLAEIVKNDAEPSFEQVEMMEAAAALPLTLTGVTASQKSMFRAFLVPDEAATLNRARQAEAYTVELAADVAKSVLTDAKLGANVLDHELGEAVQAQTLRPLNIKRADEGTVEQPAQTDAVEQPAEAAETVTEA